MEEQPGVLRGELYRIDLSKHGGSLTKSRLVLVVQNDMGNRHSSETIVAAVRDIHGGRPLPVHVRVPAGVGGLYKTSMIDAGHLFTIPQSALGARVGQLPAIVMLAVSAALARSLGLP